MVRKVTASFYLFLPFLMVFLIQFII